MKRRPSERFFSRFYFLRLDQNRTRVPPYAHFRGGAKNETAFGEPVARIFRENVKFASELAGKTTARDSIGNHCTRTRLCARARVPLAAVPASRRVYGQITGVAVVFVAVGTRRTAGAAPAKRSVLAVQHAPAESPIRSNDPDPTTGTVNARSLHRTRPRVRASSLHARGRSHAFR